MDEDVVNDLKQFIAATVTQQTSDIKADIADLDRKLSTKIDNLSQAVGEAIEQTNEATDTQLKDHEQRIGRLEHKLA